MLSIPLVAVTQCQLSWALLATIGCSAVCSDDDLYIIGAVCLSVWHKKADSLSYLFCHGGWWDLYIIGAVCLSDTKKLTPSLISSDRSSCSRPITTFSDNLLLKKGHSCLARNAPAVPHLQVFKSTEGNIGQYCKRWIWINWFNMISFFGGNMFFKLGKYWRAFDC